MLSCIPIPSSRTLLNITVSTLFFLGVASSRPTQNITIEVPYGTTNHGEPNSLCIPATWIDITTYLLLNYIAHGATIVSYPGESPLDTLFSVVIAILFPTFGVIRAFNFIIRHPLLTSRNDLEVAARSGALCMLVRSSRWKPQKGDKIKNALIKDPGNKPTTAVLSIYMPPWLNDRTKFWSYTDTDLVEIGSRVVFGFSKPPDQYKFVFVPRNTEVLGLVDSTSTLSSNVPDIPLLRSLYRIFASPVSTPKLSSSFNLVRGIVALLQSLYASFTLYHTNGGQVNRYGFAAPGLTVLPYAVMSALNIMANLIAPHYPTLYLVRSEVMEEAERRTGLSFQYVVGNLKVVDEPDTKNIVKEGWSEIAGSFNDDDTLLYVSPSAEEDEKMVEILDSSRQKIYVPACPRFGRTDDPQISPLRRFTESRPGRLEFPRYQHLAPRRSRYLQALIGPIDHSEPRTESWFFSHSSYLPLPSQLHPPSYVGTLPSRLRLPYSISNYLRRSQQSFTYIRDQFQHFQYFNVFEISLVYFIACAELFVTLALSNYSGQQSTSAQRAWIITWLVANFSVGSAIYSVGRMVSETWKSDAVSPMRLRIMYSCYVVLYGAPAIGGFVVVSQMLKEYGICYKFV